MTNQDLLLTGIGALAAVLRIIWQVFIDKLEVIEGIQTKRYEDILEQLKVQEDLCKEDRERLKAVENKIPFISCKLPCNDRKPYSINEL